MRIVQDIRFGDGEIFSLEHGVLYVIQYSRWVLVLTFVFLVLIFFFAKIKILNF